jgi:hypothetical protein
VKSSSKAHTPWARLGTPDHAEIMAGCASGYGGGTNLLSNPNQLEAHNVIMQRSGKPINRLAVRAAITDDVCDVDVLFEPYKSQAGCFVR